jgi:hypothetical protein
MDPVHRLCPGDAELVTAISQQPHRHRRIMSRNAPQSRRAQPGQRDRVRIDWIRLSALASGEHPNLRRQLGRHIHDRFTVGDQTLRQMPADAVAPLDGPDSIRMLAGGRENRLVARTVSAEPATTEHLLSAVDDLDRC